MKKILVTGANGYLGSHVVDFLIKNKFDVYCVDLCDSHIPSKAHFIKKNILEDSDNGIYKELGEPDVMIHLAWRKGFSHNATEHLSDLSSHFNFLRNMLEGGLKNLSVMGSMHEVGYHVGSINELTSCKPLSQYGIAKNALQMSLTEMVGREFKDVSFKWLRGYYICGDDENSSSIFSKILSAEKSGQKLFPFNSGKCRYDFLSIEEISRQIAIASVQTEINGIINCCSGEAVALADKVEAFIKDKNLSIKLDYGKFPDRPYDSPEVYGDNGKIKEILSKNKGFVCH